MKYKCLVFDFFGVISSEVAPFWLAKYLSASQAAAVKATIVQAADRGTLSQDELFSSLAELAGVPPALGRARMAVFSTHRCEDG